MAACKDFTGFQEATLAARPQLAVILGSGLSPVVRRLQPTCSVPFSHIPGLSRPSVDGHEGRMTLGDWNGKKVLVLEGRLHFYEGHSWEAVCQTIHVIHSLGAKVLMATNAAGGIHPSLGPGSLMAIGEHLDWTRPECKLVDASASRPSSYSTRLIGLLRQTAASCGITLMSGCYAAVLGPNYETPAEIRALAQCGADAVGMSTAREIETACELGMECSAISCITNRAAGLEKDAIITHQEVLDTAAASGRQLARLIEAFIELAG